MGEPFSYDNVPYPSFTFPKTSPERLATQAAVNGMIAADPRRCSYLELGCGDGTNLLAQAYMYPDSRFLGIDLSKNHIDSANASVAELGINNAVFLQKDVMDMDDSDFDQFDYIVAHGLFSWVPDVVRQRLLEIYSQHLAPEGIGYVSYNAYPGCHVRAMMNEIMQFHTRLIDDPIEKVANGVSVLNLIGEMTDAESTYRLIIKDELEGMLERSPENIFHDDLSEINQPFYFYEFAEMLAQNGMQYLTEAEERILHFETLSDAAAKMLDQLASDLVEREQYMDFIRYRRFRNTLFCRKEIRLDRDYLDGHINEFYIAGRLHSEADPSTVASDEPETFFGPREQTITCNHPLTKAVIRYLSSQWTRSVSFTELLDQSVEMFGLPEGSMSDTDVSQARNFIIELFRVGLFRLHCYPGQGIRYVSEKPQVSRFARWQIGRGSQTVMTFTGVSLEPDADITKLLLMLADGTRTLNDLVDAAMEKLELQGVSDQTQKRVAVEEAVKLNLETLAKNGVLEA
jgi:methyltransferase-like protein/trans-aconitate methyltransferase